MPHIQPIGATFFVTFRLAGSLSKEVVLRLKDEQIAKVVADAIRLRDKKEYDLLAYCIMPNHAHLVFTIRCDYGPSVRAEARATSTISRYSMTDILRLIKGSTAHEANKILNRTGAFWQHESYDHVVRDEKELNRIIWYTINNPVKAGLVKNAEDWKWSYYANVE